MDERRMRDDEVIRNGEHKKDVQDEEVEAEIRIWKYVFGFTEMAVVKCAIELGIPDVLESNGGSMSQCELSSALNCPPASLYRIMRFLVHFKIFNQTISPTSNVKGSSSNGGTSLVSYSQTPLSRRLTLKDHNNGNNNSSMAALLLLESSPVMLAPWLSLTNRVREMNISPFEAAHGGKDLWSYTTEHPSHSNLFSDAMACDARLVVPNIVKACPNLFHGVALLVDVGGADGTTVSILVQAFPSLRAINFDLPHVVATNKANASSIPISDGRIQHIGGNMFDSVPKADVAFLMWVLHDWADDECIEILKKCKEAIPKDQGKVIIVDAILEEDSTDPQDHKLQGVRLMLDMVMMAHTTHGKERTLTEWNHVLKKAGFSHFKVHRIQAVQSLIEAFP